MEIPHNSMKLHLLLLLVQANWVLSSASICEYSVLQGDNRYNYSLAAPMPQYPHGALSEDGFYKIAGNGTTIWFQLCDGMLFNHDPPKCFGCQDCGGPSHCGMKCSALVANYVGGYYICTTIGLFMTTTISLIDDKNPNMGVIVKMSSSGAKVNCSLSIKVFCSQNGVQRPDSMESVGSCDYATMLMHPSGCAKITPVHGRGWGWLGTLVIIILCLLGGYILTGTIYRYFALGIRGIEVIPNLEFWLSLPQRTKSYFVSLVRRFRGPSEGHRSSYSPVEF